MFTSTSSLTHKHTDTSLAFFIVTCWQSSLYECIYSVHLPISHHINIGLYMLHLCCWGGESDFEERANDTLKCFKLRRVDGQMKEPQDCQIWPFLWLLITLRQVNDGDDASLMSCVGQRADVLMHANTPQVQANTSTGLDTN